MRLLEDEQQVMLAEIDAVAAQLQSAEARAAYAELRAAAEAGEVPDELLPPLERLVEIGLETGRIRQIHSAHGEMAASRLFQRTPRGRALKETCDRANEALQSLEGQTVESLAFAPRGPGGFSLSLETDQARITVHIDREGVQVRSVEIGA
jgi:hypothetical protein